MNLGIIFRYLIQLICAIIFAASAYLKAVDFDYFELQIIELGLFNFYISGILAYGIIAIEFIISAWFVLGFTPRRFFRYFTVSFLGIFTLYLFYLFVEKGNDISCGCMGEQIRITPLQGIVKNVVLIICTFLVLSASKVNFYFKTAISNNSLILISSVLISFYLAYYLTPISFFNSKSFNQSGIARFNADRIVQNGKFYRDFNFFKEHKRYTIAFLSSSCGHCKIAAKRFSHLKFQNNELPIFLVINGDSALIDGFVREHGISNFPKTLLFKEDFVSLAGTKLPKIYLVDRDSIQDVVSARDVSVNSLKSWYFSK